MASPLSPSPSNILNLAPSRRLETHHPESHIIKMADERAADEDATSPRFASQVTMEKGGAGHNQENVSPSKSRHSRILSGTELSPLKILTTKSDSLDAEIQQLQKPASTIKSPRKVFPEKRFPVKVNSTPSPPPSVQRPQVQEQNISLEEALRHNEGLANAIQIFEDEETMLGNAQDDEPDVTSMSIEDQIAEDQIADEEPVGPDDTMVSTFSTFSAVPNMTMFARIGHSPTKFANMEATPTTVRSRRDPSPLKTPRPPAMHDTGNTTNLLMDFTEQISGFSSRFPQQTPSRHPPSTRTPRTAVAVTPSRQQSNLLDFDIPPLPTPRSIPTVTPRELESLKSGFLSEISGLKASLSGKEAEVSSLKTAVGDAEKRVGECMEQLREIRAVKETISEEKESWEKRGREMETVLRKVKEEIVMGQREREELESKLEESEKRREAAEIMAQEAESKMAGMRAGKATDAGSEGENNKSPDKAKSAGSREVEIAVERVARELHALYKSKHENKVSALKNSYEKSYEKKIRGLESKIDELVDENESLRFGRDTTMTKVDPNQSIVDEERKVQAVKDSAQIKELTAEIEKLEAVVSSVKGDNQELRQLLEKERVEKGELVILAEEMMSMQSFVQKEEAPPSAPAPTPALARTPAPARPAAPKVQHPGPESFRNSIGSRTSGLRAPGSIKKPTESRIGGVAHERPKHGTSQGGLPRPGSGMGARSGIMSSIEKMGSYRGRGD
ncbi:hypothetical protein F4821DRAFT_154969 [Hypoxylon rubiginosum]|uniref:Uncharacterized protein n=1 Tax=Hypoxylon rubiginosum TaxID=110542 RepID=A0ACC0DGV4_9PEZI|nr:hypothetical protein F4821DRAFT_154969 [Hypoxylon rubiginosum]